jgi:ATP-dependent helicase/nuclease subunit B
MPVTSYLFAPGPAFWANSAAALLAAHPRELAAVQVLVPAFSHAQLLKQALAAQLRRPFISPRINTVSGWLAQHALDHEGPLATGDNARLMALYAELRQHAWLKKLFTARSNTDLLPLAELLLTLSDELTRSLLPTALAAPDALSARWEQALAALSPPARKLLSDEAQLVWTIWQSQLESKDKTVLRHAQMLALAGRAADDLVWINPVAPDDIEQAFLQAYGRRRQVSVITLDWRPAALPALLRAAWPELAEAPEAPAEAAPADSAAAPAGWSLAPASSLEQEAQHGAQTVLDWLAGGKSAIAIVAQDRVVARRIRALLERAQVLVADETGWKLSTTRAAAALSAWMDVVASRADTVALLDFLKSPFFNGSGAGRAEQIMALETALRRANVQGGWRALQASAARLQDQDRYGEPQLSTLVQTMAAQAALFVGSKSIAQWAELTLQTLAQLGMDEALAADAAGRQLQEMIAALGAEHGAGPAFSFSEWRACLGGQMESIAFIAAASDSRVLMLPLNGARLRRFDAVLMVGADASHLPSQAAETLFFANAVRAELGLATRESRQRQQMRDFAELLLVNPVLVLSWQAQQDGEPNPLSPWLTRIELALARAGASPLARHAVRLQTACLTAQAPVRPQPVAPELAPATLSASGYNSFMACPYQFFASRMLRLKGLDELSDMPEKRDYGGWLHAILDEYHATLLREPGQDRTALMTAISARIFGTELEHSAAALGYYVRWQKVMPSYLAWANGREAEGWIFAFGEQAFERSFEGPGWQVTLNGRIDRIDRMSGEADDNGDGKFAVLDYKTNNLLALRAKLKGLEDQQLPFYGILSGLPVVAAHYVALELSKDKNGDKTGDVEAPDYARWRAALLKHIGTSMAAISGGAPLPANGVASICQYCEVRGLCRKGAW